MSQRNELSTGRRRERRADAHSPPVSLQVDRNHDLYIYKYGPACTVTLLNGTHTTNIEPSLLSFPFLTLAFTVPF
jgi:hypothetical protein